jgi:Flp pilus assembly pilin Flp
MGRPSLVNFSVIPVLPKDRPRTNLASNDDAQSTIEYALIVGVCSLLIVAGLGVAMQSFLSAIMSAFQEGVDALI